MASDLGTLAVVRVIVHEIPPRPVRAPPSAASGPVLSEIESPLTVGLKNYFRERILTTLTESAYDVLFDATTVSPVPGLVLDHLYLKNTDFVLLSQQIAHHLYQTENRPHGQRRRRCVTSGSHCCCCLLVVPSTCRRTRVATQRRPTTEGT